VSEGLTTADVQKALSKVEEVAKLIEKDGLLVVGLRILPGGRISIDVVDGMSDLDGRPPKRRPK
jgi:hypothetical protein